MPASETKLKRWNLLPLVVLLYGVTSAAQLNAVYVQSNISASGQNSVLGYSIDSQGKLTPLPGSPYQTGGTGWTVPDGMQLGLQADDDHQIIVNNDGTRLFAVNGHSNDVSSFLINADGSLTLTGAPVPSGGSQPASLALFDGVLSDGGSLLSVVNKSSDALQTNPPPPNLVSMTVDSSGQLTPNVGSKVLLPVETSPTQVSAAPGNIALVEQLMGLPAMLYAYRIRSSGRYELLSSQPSPVRGSILLGQAVNASAGVFYAGVSSSNGIGVFSFSPKTGATKFLRIVGTPGTLPCWLAINPATTRLYVSETGTNTVSVFDTTNPRVPVVLQELSLADTGNPGPWNIAVDPENKFVYVITGTALHIVNIQSDGTLIENLSPFTLPVPAGTFPYGLATILK